MRSELLRKLKSIVSAVTDLSTYVVITFLFPSIILTRLFIFKDEYRFHFSFRMYSVQQMDVENN